MRVEATDIGYVVPEPDELTAGAAELAGADREVIRGYLRAQRHSLLNVCAGLRAEQLVARPIPSTGLTLLGLVRHLAKAERIWIRERAAGEDVSPLYGGSGRTLDFTELDPAQAEEAVATLQAEWAACDAAVDALPWDTVLDWRGQKLSLAAVHVHLITEYARHNGHADLIREALDGATAR